MASPAREARQRFSADGFTEIVNRGRGSLLAKKPGTNKFAIETSIGNIGWHYGAGLEVDTSWEVDTGAWQYRMLKAEYNIHARNVLNAGTLVEYREPVSGQWVAFQPLGLNWVNDQDSRQQIAITQAVAAQATDDILYWANGYGTGRHFRYQADPAKLVKQIIIDSAANLPAPTVTGTPYLEIEFIISKSTGVTEWFDSGSGYQLWNRATTVLTTNRIEYRTPGGEVLWALDYPRAWDSDRNNTIGQFQLRRQGANRYCTVRIPKTWVDAAVFPIHIDPTIEPAVGTSTGDANQQDTGSNAETGNVTFFVGGNPGGGINRYGGYCATVTGPASGDTIDVAYVNIYFETATIDMNMDCQAVDDAALFAATSNNISSRTLTGNAVTWTATGSNFARSTSPSMVTPFQAVINRAGWASGQDIAVVAVGRSATANKQWTYNMGSAFGAIYHIEYTVATTPASLVIPRKSKTYIRR